MIYISASKSVATLIENKVAICSFPASLNKSIPTVYEAMALCAFPIITSDKETKHIDSGKVDSKNRAIGYNVSVWSYKGVYYVAVQNTRLIKNKVVEFGVMQRGKKCISLDQAWSLGKQIARERIAKL